VTQNIHDNLKIKENIERFNVVSKATSDAIYDWDLVQNEGVWNKGLVGIFGHRRTGSTTIDWWLSMVHPEDVERVAQKIQTHLKNKKSRWKDEYRFRCSDNTYKHVLDRGFIIYNDAGEAIRMIGAIQDITDRVNHVKAIEEQNQRLQEIAWTQSHVVRAPVARILGLSELMKGNDNDHSMIAEFLPFLIESTQELDQVIREIVKKTEMISVKR
jgi:PAS domain S-box-containing protein